MRKYHANEDNCLQCCIAGILDLHLDEVVNVAKVRRYWVDTLIAWARHNDKRILFSYEHPSGIPYIGIVAWEIRGCHAIVMHDGAQIYDPNPAHIEIFTTTMYNIIILEGKTNDTELTSNGKTLSTFMDSNDSTKE